MLRFAFIGFRHSHIRSLYDALQRDKRFIIAGTCEEDAPTRTALRREGKVAITHDRCAKMLAEVDCDVVAVGDYFGIRGQRIVAALRAGKHVVSDKPICTRLDELAEIERLARTKRLCVSCQFDTRSLGQFLKARAVVRAGTIGEVHGIHVAGQHPLLLGTRPQWYFEKGKQGGTINDIAVHVVDFIPWVTGLRVAEIVAARTWNAFAESYPQFKDAGQFILRMNNGCGVTGDVSYFLPDSQGYTVPQYWRTTFYGRDGLLEVGTNMPGVLLARNGERKPRTLAPLKSQPFFYLHSLAREIRGHTDGLTLTTREVLDASRVALQIQRVADSET